MNRRIVLASSNHAKVCELRAMLADAAVDLVTQGDLGVGPADEVHATFIENALAKARHASAATGLPAIADDSGLCVDVLGGAPGVLSARFAPRLPSEACDDARNNCELLKRLDGFEDRRAHYVCVLVALRAAADPEPLVVDARWHGEVLRAPRGQNGFGYDPLFLIRELGLTAAELDPAHKNRISHRGQALSALASSFAHWNT